MRTELGRSQVEVQRCALSWGAPRLREVEVDADMVEEKRGGGRRGRGQLVEEEEEEAGKSSDKI